MPADASRNRITSIGMGFLAGYVDTLGFIALFGLFTAHVTGNFVLIAVALADSSQASILLKFLAFPAFILGIASARLLIAAVQQRHGPALRLVLALQAVLLAGFMLCGWLASPIGTTTTTLAMAAGLFGTAAMGVHSATSRLMLTQLAPTSMMTGNVTQIVIDAVDALRGAGDAGLGARCAKFLWPLAAFAAGCICAAFAYIAFGFLALAAPLAILLYEIATATEPAPA